VSLVAIRLLQCRICFHNYCGPQGEEGHPMNPEQNRRPEDELKDRLRRLKDEIRLRDVELTNIEWQLRLIAEIMRGRKLYPD
jgi:hypothetical protein